MAAVSYIWLLLVSNVDRTHPGIGDVPAGNTNPVSGLHLVSVTMFKHAMWFVLINE